MFAKLRRACWLLVLLVCLGAGWAQRAPEAQAAPGAKTEKAKKPAAANKKPAASKAGKKPAAAANKKAAKKPGAAADKKAGKKGAAKKGAAKKGQGKTKAAARKPVPPAVSRAMRQAQALAAAIKSPPIGDARIRMARRAFYDSNTALLVHLERNHKDGHPLQMYVTMWRILDAMRQGNSSDAQVRQFLNKHPNTAAGEYLRGEWLKQLAKDGLWQTFLAELGGMQQPLSRELRCLHWQAQMAAGEDGRRAVLPEVMAVWMEEVREVKSCDEVFTDFAAWQGTPTEARWARFRRMVDSPRPQEAAEILARMPDGGARARDAYVVMLRQPAGYLDKPPADFEKTRAGREVVMAAMVRLAREDALAAHARLKKLGSRLSGAERAAVYASLGMHGAQSHLPQAAQWFDEAGVALMFSAQRAWRVRAFLRNGDWAGVGRTIAMMPEDEQNEPVWMYWRARSLAEQGQPESAKILWEHLRGDTSFYGLLAANELGETFSAPKPSPVVADEALMASAKADPSLSRALTLLRLDMRAEGLREWAWGVRRVHATPFLLAAAQLAADAGFYDRAIYTAERIDSPRAFSLLYPRPYRQLIEPQAREQGLDPGWVYGLMRQESRFMAPAQSPVGAQGLMQVMPATGQWVANKIGMTDYTAARLREPRTNVQIGVNYMRIVQEGSGGQEVLTSASYNAGPGRARRWRAARALDGAVYTETIPFNETRDYVRKVMTNATIYAAQIEGKPQSLKKRLGTVPPAGQ